LSHNPEYKKQEYITIVSHKLKLSIIKNIYNGRYVIEGRGKCPICYEEGFIINTDTIRSTSLEFHHETEKKETEYSAIKMFQAYQSSKSDPFFLNKLIKKMESDNVRLVCRAHHQIEHSKHFKNFEYLINYKEVFLLPAQLIYIIIRISVNNNHLTQYFSKDQKRTVQDSIIAFFRKRYILESEYGEKCPACQEFTIKKHLPAFDFCHKKLHNFHENPYIHENHKSYIKSAGQLYNKSYSCSEITKILEYENGGYLCRNCHKVMDYSSIRLDLLSKIYDDKIIEQKILNDYKGVKKNFKVLIHNNSLGNPLDTNLLNKKNLEKYLNAIYAMSQQGLEITYNSLGRYMSLKSRSSSFEFIKRRIDFLNNFLAIEHGKGYGRETTKIKLTEQGKKYIELIHHFEDYYKTI